MVPPVGGGATTGGGGVTDVPVGGATGIIPGAGGVTAVPVPDGVPETDPDGVGVDSFAGWMAAVSQPAMLEKNTTMIGAAIRSLNGIIHLYPHTA
jgi:hypothetical protein